ncbi:MAG: M24 family metallopeptidase [Armatimonadota bacterium]
MNTGTSNLPIIPEGEFTLRMQQFKGKMAQEGMDLVVVFSNLLDPSAVRYFADVASINESVALVIPLEGEPILCSGQACHEWSRHKSKVKDIRIMPEVGEVSGVEYAIEGLLDFEDFFNEMKGRYHVGKIGIIGDLIFPYAIYRKLLNVFPSTPTVSAEMLMYALRMRKSPHELACIRKAGQIISQTFAYATERIKPGVTELEIQADIEGEMLRLGAESYANSFAPMIPSGVQRSNLCMNRNTLRPVQEGEIIDLQAGCVYEGYNAVICTPVVLGPIPQEIRRAVQVADEALNITAQAMKPGISSRELYSIYSAFLEQEGYRQYSPYGSVHSLGMLECESPFFSAVRDVYMVEDMAVAIDAYFKGLPWGSFRIEDTFIIQADGPEKVTTFNQGYLTRYL